LLNEWEGYEKQHIELQINLKNRSDQIAEISNEMLSQLLIWQETKDDGIKNKVSSKVIESIDEVIETINSITININIRMDSLFLIQKKITDQALIIDDVINEIVIKQENLQSNYFIIDSPNIWNAKDSISTLSIVKATVYESVKHDSSALWEYLMRNRSSFFSQIFFLIALLFLFIYLNYKWIKNMDPQKSNLDKNTFVILSNPIASVLAIGVLISSFLYTNSPPFLGEITIVVILASAVYLLPKLTVKRLRLLLFLLLLLLLLNLAGNYIGVKAFIVRLVSILSALVVVFILIDFRYNKSFKNFYNRKRSKLLSSLIYLFLILSVFGFVANIIGSVNLADFVYQGVMLSMVFAAITWLAVEIFVDVTLLLTREDPDKEISTISSFKLLIQKRLRSVLYLGGFILWIYLTLIGFSVIKYVINSFTKLMEVKWVIGELTISLGGIISFLIIIIITVIITKIISNLFRDDWIENTALPKGSSPAISIVLRIIVTTLGFYLAAASAGIDLSQFGFILGALSVGIGFGLQSVVLNFIAGLILAFERPIHVGDKIEVDMEFGIVTEIGIRASKVKTWAGTEVIIPNGDLVSKKVVNYTLSDEKRRFKIPFRTAIDTDPEQVILILTNIATMHPNTLKEKAPKTYFWGYGDTSLDFFLYFWTEFDVGMRTRSEIMLEAHKELKAAGIQLAIPIRKMRIDKDDSDIIFPQSS
jgi:small-conductance mechanosensitive channel